MLNKKILVVSILCIILVSSFFLFSQKDKKTSKYSSNDGLMPSSLKWTESFSSSKKNSDNPQSNIFKYFNKKKE